MDEIKYFKIVQKSYKKSFWSNKINKVDVNNILTEPVGHKKTHRWVGLFCI